MTALADSVSTDHPHLLLHLIALKAYLDWLLTVEGQARYGPAFSSRDHKLQPTSDSTMRDWVARTIPTVDRSNPISQPGIFEFRAFSPAEMSVADWKLLGEEDEYIFSHAIHGWLYPEKFGGPAPTLSDVFERLRGGPYDDSMHPLIKYHTSYTLPDEVHVAEDGSRLTHGQCAARRWRAYFGELLDKFADSKQVDDIENPRKRHRTDARDPDHARAYVGRKMHRSAGETLRDA